MNETENNTIRTKVRETYAGIATAGSSCCGPSTCDTDAGASLAVGYTGDELVTLPAGADLGLGCGNPQAIANLKKGETVIDLGSGAGIDCFLASKQVGATGTVIGVDMTAEMLAKARKNAVAGDYTNVQFRLGEIENLPVADGVADVIMSNCVINLSTDKSRVYNEAFRVLRPGGRLAISDIVTTAELPVDIRNDPSLYSACVSGALSVDELKKIISKAGFTDIRIEGKEASRDYINKWDPNRKAADYIMSANIEGVKP